MQLPERDGDGYLVDMNAWTPEIGRSMAEADGIEIDDTKWEQILKAREYYEENAVVPPIRKFAKYMGADQKEMFKMWMTGPMKPITKYGTMKKAISKVVKISKVGQNQWTCISSSRTRWLRTLRRTVLCETSASSSPFWRATWRR